MHEGPTSSLPCTVKGTHTITLTFKPMEDGATQPWIGFYDPVCDYCGKDMTGARLRANGT